MSFMNWIVSGLNDASDFFYSIYLEVLDWVWPFWLAAGFFYSLSSVFSSLAWAFYDFGEWVLDVATWAGDIFSWDTIRDLIRSWLPDLEWIVEWIPQMDAWLDGVLDSFTRYVFDTVQSWLDSITGVYDTLKAEWDTFWTVTFPNLVNFTWLSIWWDSRVADIQGLIDSAFTIREGFWEGWQDWRDSVAEFFSDPLEWLWAKFADWFLGPEV